MSVMCVFVRVSVYIGVCSEECSNRDRSFTISGDVGVNLKGKYIAMMTPPPPPIFYIQLLLTPQLFFLNIYI